MVLHTSSNKSPKILVEAGEMFTAIVKDVILIPPVYPNHEHLRKPVICIFF